MKNKEKNLESLLKKVKKLSTIKCLYFIRLLFTIKPQILYKILIKNFNI